MKQYIIKTAILILFTGLILPVISCKQMPYTPLENDIIYLKSDATYLVPGESATIDLTGVKANGMAMPDQTLVRLLSDNGKFLDLQGKEVGAVLLSGGRGRIIFQSDLSFEGEAISVTAQSGTAVIQPEQLVFPIRVIDITQVYMLAQPLKLPPSGGTSTITVTAYDNAMEVVPGKKIFLETTAGTLNPPSPLITGTDGKVTLNLETTEPATVTATYKEVSKSLLVDVGINQPPEPGFAFSPQNPLMGETIYFTSTSTDPDGEIASYQWSFGDGTTSDQANPTHVFPVTAEPKEYQVVLTVSDDAGKSASIVQPVSFALKEISAPTADFTFSPQNPGIGETVSFTDLSSDEDGSIVAYQWFFGDGGSSTQQNPQHRYSIDEPAVFNVQLTVTDNDGQSATIIKEIIVGNIDNQPPTADFSYTPEEPIVGDTIQFLQQCEDDGQITSYYWDFGDGFTSEEENPSHRYDIFQPATFIAKLTVTDDSGKTAAVSKVITIAEAVNQPPKADFAFSPKEPQSGETVYFNASASSDPDGEIIEYHWDFGDGHTGAEVPSDKTPKHTYYVTETTTFTVTLTVIDDKGGQGVVSKDIKVVVEENQPPTADFSFSPVTPVSGETVHFNAGASADPDGTIVQYNWDFGDGSTGTGVNPDHVFHVTVETTFTVTLTVIDDKGASSTVSKEIKVTPN